MEKLDKCATCRYFSSKNDYCFVYDCDVSCNDGCELHMTEREYEEGLERMFHKGKRCETCYHYNNFSLTCYVRGTNGLHMKINHVCDRYVDCETGLRNSVYSAGYEKIAELLNNNPRNSVCDEVIEYIVQFCNDTSSWYNNMVPTDFIAYVIRSLEEKKDLEIWASGHKCISNPKGGLFKKLRTLRNKIKRINTNK